MTNITRIKLGILFLGLMLLNCKTREQIVVPSPLTAITNDYLGNKLSIKDFSFPNSTIKVPLEYNPQENYIILTLPKDFNGDLIAPIINLTDNATQILPKSGENVVFEGKRAIEYTVTKKDGQSVKFKLYVVRQDKINAEVFTKNITLNSKEDTYIKFKINNIGTLDIPQEYGQGNIPNLKIFDSNNKNVFSSVVFMNGNDTTTTFISNKGYEFFKKGNFTMSLSMNEDTLLGKIRKSDVFNFKIINGSKAFINPYYIFENLWTINKEHIIKGVNFDINKKYRLIFSNDFTAPMILTPKYIDENSLSLTVPINADTVQYRVLFKENEDIIADREGYVKNVSIIPYRGCSFYETENSWIFIDNSKPLSFAQNEVFGAYYVVSYGNNSSEAYTKGDLKLIGINDKKEYLIRGKLITGIWDGSASLWSFKIPESVPKGSYEVYGINSQVDPSRHWRKLEIK